MFIFGTGQEVGGGFPCFGAIALIAQQTGSGLFEFFQMFQRTTRRQQALRRFAVNQEIDPVFLSVLPQIGAEFLPGEIRPLTFVEHIIRGDLEVIDALIEPVVDDFRVWVAFRIGQGRADGLQCQNDMTCRASFCHGSLGSTRESLPEAADQVLHFVVPHQRLAATHQNFVQAITRRCSPAGAQ